MKNIHYQKVPHHQTNIVEYLPDATFAIDNEKRIIAWNRAIVEMTGIKKEYMLGRDDYSLPFYGEKRPLLIDLVYEPEEKLRKYYATIVRKEVTTYGEGFVPRLRKGKGAYLWGIAAPLLDHAGNIVGAVESLRDITEKRHMEQALRESEDRYRSFVENASDIIFCTDNNGHFTLVNPALLRILGYKKEEIIGKHYRMLIRTDMVDAAIKFFELQFVREIECTYSEYPVCTKDGRELWFGQNVRLIREGGHIVGFHAMARDITDRKQAEKALRESEFRYRTLVETTNDFVFIVDRQGLVTYVNPNFERVTDYALSELEGRPFTMVIAPEERKTITEKFKQGVKSPDSRPYEAKLIRKERSHVVVEFLTSNIYDDKDRVTGRFGVGRDITKRKEMEKILRNNENKYRELSITDDLTKLYNSRCFYHQLEMECDRANRYGEAITLLFLDLDDFKKFNDAYGHVEGDKVLMRLGQVIKKCLRKTDSAYRYGGEEFSVILPMTESKNAAITAERIKNEFQKEIFSPMPGKGVHVTMSIGLAQFKLHEGIKAFVHRVDQLMYQAKKSGKDKICYEP